MDVATIAKEFWQAVSQLTIQNCYKKASIIGNWEDEDKPSQEEKDSKEINDDFDDTELINNMVSLDLIDDKDISSLMKEMDEIVHMDDSNAPEYINAISEEVDEILETSLADKDQEKEDTEDLGVNAESKQADTGVYVLPDNEEIDLVV
jgi:hypothetical protein